jgi:hypothetical protein
MKALERFTSSLTTLNLRQVNVVVGRKGVYMCVA